jgi:hypothetical protein
LLKFKDTFTGYVQWEVELINYLSGLKGKSGVPLVYVIRKNETVRDDQEFLSMVDELIAEAPLAGAGGIPGRHEASILYFESCLCWI